MELTFGPVPSRRLGRSLGINNIPPKICTYACTYCQLGKTNKMRTNRREFYPVQDIVNAVESKITQLQKQKETIDYLAFVPDGEPTLDINLGKAIKALKAFEIPIAVISNASLVDDPAVREDLMIADWVSLKVDAVTGDLWRAIDRPQHRLDLESILKGIIKFSRDFDGELTTETMLINNLNDKKDHIKNIAEFLTMVDPDKAYLSIPSRPPAEKGVKAPEERVLNQACQIFDSALKHVEYLIGYEGNDFSITGDTENDILSITAVHPIREDAMRDLLENNKAEWTTVDELIEQGKLTETEYEDHKFYVRKFKH